MRICRRSRLRKKTFLVLFFYMMAFGYTYIYFVQYVAIMERQHSSQLSFDDVKVSKNDMSYKLAKPLIVGNKKSALSKYKEKVQEMRNMTNINNMLKQIHTKNSVQKPMKKPNRNPLKKSYIREFKYPLYINLTHLVHQLESGDSPFNVTPINPHPYNFLYTPNKACGYDPNIKYPRILILVKSSVQNFIRRDNIRKTWGSVQKDNIDIVFLLGLPKQGNLAVRQESAQYDDIVQEDFIDNYRNNTFKMIMGYKWAVSNCKRVDFLFFVDDDYYVNIYNVHDYLKSVSSKHSLFTGTLLGSSVPYRVSGSKWYMPWEDYPFDKYPPYIAGGAYFVSLALARKFYLAFKYVKPMHIDDVYLGIVARKLDIKPTGLRKIGYRKLPKGSLKTMIASHGYSKIEDVQAAWDFINQKPQPVVIQSIKNAKNVKQR